MEPFSSVPCKSREGFQRHGNCCFEVDYEGETFSPLLSPFPPKLKKLL